MILIDVEHSSFSTDSITTKHEKQRLFLSGDRELTCRGKKLRITVKVINFKSTTFCIFLIIVLNKTSFKKEKLMTQHDFLISCNAIAIFRVIAIF